MILNCDALFVVHTNAEHLHQVSHEGGGGGREGTVETVIEEFKRRSNQPLCRTMGTCDTGGGQTEHPGGGQVRTWSRGGGGSVSRCAGLWGHGDAGGGQTEHPGGGLEGEGGESVTHTCILGLVLGQSHLLRPVP